jgi:hypothetical protein
LLEASPVTFNQDGLTRVAINQNAFVFCQQADLLGSRPGQLCQVKALQIRLRLTGVKA